VTQIEVGPGVQRPRKKTSAWPFVVLGVLFLLGGALLVGWLLLPGFLLRYVEKEARAQGVVLRDCSLEFSFEQIELSACAFELVDVPGISGTIGKATIELLEYEPKSVLVEQAAVVVRELPDVPTGERVPRWLEQRAKLGKDAKIPIAIRDSRLDLFGADEQGNPDGVPLVTLTNLEYDSQSEAVKGDIAIGGAITGKFTHQGTRSELDVALKLSPQTRGRFSVETQADGAEVRADFQGLPLALFSLPPIVRLPEELLPVQVDGQLYALVPFGLDTKGIRGDFRFTLAGLPMPVPPEIAGLVYGPDVLMTGKFKLHDNYQEVDVSKLAVKAGVLELRGDAHAAVKGLRAPLQAKLRGALSCGAILEAATRAHTDSPLFINAAKLGRRFVQGSVDIVIGLDADLLKLEQAKLLKTIGVGCGLKPAPVPAELRDLGERILKDLPSPPPFEAPDLRLPAPPRIELPDLPELRRRRNLGQTDGEGSAGAAAE
jgi:hypothetical protein